MAMKKPTHHEPPQLLACWFQFREEIAVPGLSFRHNFAIDLRDLRGRNEIVPRVSAAHKMGRNERAKRDRRLMAILEVLAIPGEYMRLIQRGSYRITSAITHSVLELEEESTSENVACLLASQGLTMATADDAWQYCYNLVQLMAADDRSSNFSTSPVDAKALLARIDSKVAEIGKPTGINSPDEDIFPRPSNLPLKRKQH